MTSVTVSGGEFMSSLNFSTPDGSLLAQGIVGNLLDAGASATAMINDADSTTFLPQTTTGIVFSVSGSATVVGTGPVSNVLSGNGDLVFYGVADDTENVAIVSGNNSIGTGLGSIDDIVTGSGNDVIFANGSGTIDASSGRNTILLGAGSNMVTTYGFGDLIAIGTGMTTVAEGGTNALIFGGMGGAIIADTGTYNTVVGGSGASTVFGGSNGTYFLSQTTTLFVSSVNSSGSDTIVGSSANEQATVFGGTHDVIFANASNLTYVAGGGAATINGGSGADTIFGSKDSEIAYYADKSASSTGLMVAGDGAETLTAGTSTANIKIFAGSGNASLVGGFGDDTIVGGSGSNTVTGGAGSNTFSFIDGQGGGSELVTDFKQGDHVVLVGYGADAVTQALATAKSAAGSTTITLADNTKVTFTGAPALNSTNVFSV